MMSIAWLIACLLTMGSDPARTISSIAHDEPGTRLTWTIERIGRERAPAAPLTEFFETHGSWDAWVMDRGEFVGEGAGAVIVRVERVPEAGGWPGDIDDHWPEPAFITRLDEVEWDSPEDDAKRVRGVLHRGWVAAYVPADPDDAAGVAVLLPGMFGTPRWVIEEWTSHLVKRGWFVVRLITQSSRFTEFAPFNVSDRRPAKEAAAEIAATIDSRLFQCAFTVHAGLFELERLVPDSVRLPRVVMGISGGAIALPAVATWEPRGYDAAVLVAGGADFMSIAATSSYAPFISATKFHDRGRPARRERLDEIAKLYREVSLADPYSNAPKLSDVPTLVIHAERDEAVPAEFGDLLWERLGRPERWSYPVGHEMIALALPTMFDDIIDWAERAAGVAPVMDDAPEEAK